MSEFTISAELLEKAGFKEYTKDMTLEFGERFFQKKYTNEKGTKYFINCRYFWFSTDEGQTTFWSFFTQLEIKGHSVKFETVQWFNQDGVHSGKTIKDIEDYFSWLWQVHKKPYYELYEGRGDE